MYKLYCLNFDEYIEENIIYKYVYMIKFKYL